MNVVMMNFFVGWTTPVNDIGTSEWCEDPKIEGKVVKVQLDIVLKSISSLPTLYARFCFSLSLWDDSSET